ncbi:hypothetical protein DL767_010231 [Monosporascus sp. MG133]|nr:hypothetical protein DL767_010231 [Monosporascus sp. MG133]
MTTPNQVFKDLCKFADVTHTLATQLEALSRKGQWPPSDAAPLDLFALRQKLNYLIRSCGELKRAATAMGNAAVNGIVTQLLRLADDSKDPPDKLRSFFDEKKLPTLPGVLAAHQFSLDLDRTDYAWPYDRDWGSEQYDEHEDRLNLDGQYAEDHYRG